MFRMLLIAAVTCTAFSTMTAKAADPPRIESWPCTFTAPSVVRLAR